MISDSESVSIFYATNSTYNYEKYATNWFQCYRYILLALFNSFTISPINLTLTLFTQDTMSLKMSMPSVPIHYTSILTFNSYQSTCENAYKLTTNSLHSFKCNGIPLLFNIKSSGTPTRLYQ